MSRKARALPSPALDDRSVTTASTAERWRALFGSELPQAAGFIEQAIAWQEQVLVYGDVGPAIGRDLAVAARQIGQARENAAPRSISVPEPNAAPRSGLPSQPPAASCSVSDPELSAAPRTRSRALRTAPAPLPTASSQLVPGARLVKTHGGRTHVVEVTTAGFLYEGAAFTSLSAVAKHITGTHWNGLLFFGLRRRKTYPAKAVSHG